MNQHPLGMLLVLMLALAAGLLWAVFLVGGIEYAYHRIGVSEGAMFGVVFGSLLGGAINIPIARLPARSAGGAREVQAFGVRYRIPAAPDQSTTTLAVNLGGAVIPTGMSVYLLVHDKLGWQAAAGVAFVAVLVHLIARPVKGMGIAIPGLIPPLLAAGISLAIDPHLAAPLAYVSGSLGTLIGADLSNLNKLSSLGGGVASIGGAGTFDGVFLSGIVAVLLVGLVR
jgi:uncharacterized membrane protein